MEEYYKLKLFKELKKIQSKYQIDRIYDIDKIHLLDISLFSEEDKNIFKDFLNNSTKSKFKRSLRKAVKKVQRRIKNNIINTLSKDEILLLNILNSLGVFYFVGGCVRDAALNLRPKDFDLSTYNDLDDLKDILIKSFSDIEISDRGKHFQVMIVRMGTAEFEIARFRKDIGTDGRRPDSVVVSDIFEDAKRRDFTINAGYINTKTFNIYDPNCQFIDDISSITLRFISNPDERIKEDFLRGIRFYRFANRGFIPDKKSLSAVRRNMKNILKNINSNRFISEIERISLADV